MKKLEPAVYSKEDIDRLIAELYWQWKTGNKEIREQFAASSEEAAKACITHHVSELVTQERVYRNNKYQVNVREFTNSGVHLSIKRIDREPIHDWRDLQEIKNQLVGPECEAIELYPAESRRVDSANQFHLWAMTSETYRFPIGFNSGRFCTESSINGSVQRPFEKEAE
ncbi:MAG: hypothetical protein JWM68_3752 [Verrucomicrobiales bacterium]|nr:hypothetical protein [Verrucomicrobiales bacterium]